MKKIIHFLFLVLPLHTLVITTNAQEVGGQFTSGKLKYEITSVQPNKVKVVANEIKPKGDIVIPKKVENNAITYQVTAIGRRAFFFCESLTSITIPNTIESIGQEAFAYWSGLTSVVIPESVTHIADSAFIYCTFLRTITLPNSTQFIGNRAFYGCYLQTIFSNIKNVSNVILGKDIFYHVEKSECTLYVPKGKVSEYKKAKQWKEFNQIKDNKTSVPYVKDTTPITIIGKNITISKINNQQVALYTLSGKELPYSQKVQDNITFTVEQIGIYILQIGNITQKIFVR